MPDFIMLTELEVIENPIDNNFNSFTMPPYCLKNG